MHWMHIMLEQVTKVVYQESRFSNTFVLETGCNHVLIKVHDHLAYGYLTLGITFLIKFFDYLTKSSSWCSYQRCEIW